MITLLNRLFNVRRDEWPRLLLLYLMLTVGMVGIIWGDTIVVAAFYEQVGVEFLPLLFIVDALTSIVAIGIYTAFADRVANDRLMLAILLISVVGIAVGLLFLRSGAIAIAYPFLYLILYVPLYEIFSVQWSSYVADFYDTRTAKRIVPVLGTAGRLAGILGGLSMPLLNNTLGFSPSGIITLWLGALLVMAALIWLLPTLLQEKKEIPPAETGFSTEDEERSYMENLREGFHFIQESTYLRWLAISTLLLLMLFAFLNYQASEIMVAELGTTQAISNFIGRLTGIANLIMLPIQLFFLSRIIERVGLGNATMIFPLGTLAISGSLVLFRVLPAAALAYLNRTYFYAAFGIPIDELLYNAIPLRVKGRARAFVGGLIFPIGSLAGGILLLLPLIDTTWFVPSLIAVTATLYVASMWFVRREYARALIQLLEQEDFSFLLQRQASEITVVDPATLNWLKDKLDESKSAEFTIFMARLISDIGGRGAVPILAEAAASGTPHVRATILDILLASDVRGNAVRSLYREALADPDVDVRQSAVAGLRQVEGAESATFLDEAQTLLADPALEIRALVLPDLLRAPDPAQQQAAESRLQQILEGQNPQERARGVRVLGQIGDEAAIRRLLPYLTAADDQVRLEAAVAVESALEKGLPGAVLPALIAQVEHLRDDPVERVRQASLRVLGHTGARESYPLLVSALGDNSPQVRATAVDALVRLGKRAIPIVHAEMDSADPARRKMGAVVLSRINQREYGPLITSHVNGNLLTIYQNYGKMEALAVCAAYPAVAMLQDTYRERGQSLVDEIFYLLSAIHDPEAVDLIRQSLQSDDPRVRANALEALESLTTPQISALIAPLLEPDIPVARLRQLGRQVWEMEPVAPADLLRGLVTATQGDPWLRELAIFALGEIGAAAQAKAPPTQPPAGKSGNPLDLLADTPDENPAAPPRRRRRTSADLFDALAGPSGEGEAEAEPEPPSRRRRRNAADLFGALMDDDSTAETGSPAGRPAESKPPQAVAAGGACASLFAAPEIESLLKQAEEAAAQSNAAELQKATTAARQILAGRRVTEWTARAVESEEESVLSTIEKIIFLKEVPFFQGMTVDQLKVLASVCEEQFFPEDTRIYDQGDAGGVLYVVVNGRVGIERAGQRKGSYARLRTLDSHAYFGEMDLFDNSPRSASAIALQDTLSLRLRREPLIALARQHPDMSLELINVLSGRLREATDQIAGLTRSKPRQLHKLYDQFD